jgi:hypothetical protein
MRKKADESASEYAGRIFEEEQRQAAAQAEAAHRAQLAEEQRAYDRAVGIERVKGEIRASTPTEAVRTLQALRDNPELAAVDERRGSSRAPRINNTTVMPGEKPFAEKSYEDIRKWEADASAANNALSAVSDIRGLMSGLDGGRIEQVLSYVQEFAPALMPRDSTNLVAVRQSFAGAVQPLMAQNLEMMRGLGAMSEKEFEAAMQSLPKFGQDKVATEFLLGLVERKSRPIVQRAEGARSFMETNPEFERTGFLRFNPMQYSPAPGSAPPASPKADDPLGLR